MMKYGTLMSGLLGALGLIAIQTASAQQHVTDEMLRTAQEDPNNWLMVTGNYTGNRFSKLGQINTDNVRNLVPKWSKNEKKHCTEKACVFLSFWGPKSSGNGPQKSPRKTPKTSGIF